MNAGKLLPFVPSGKDYELAQRFFEDLGFEKIRSDEHISIFRNKEVEFFLQNYHNDEFASNYMVALSVQDLDGFWDHIQQAELEEKYGVRVAEPTVRPWGREISLIDPAGVCWHITQTS